MCYPSSEPKVLCGWISGLEITQIIENPTLINHFRKWNSKGKEVRPGTLLLSTECPISINYYLEIKL